MIFFVVQTKCRVGRTGRANRQGRAITFFTNDEMEHPTKLRYVVTIMKQAGFDVADYLQNFKELSKLTTVKRKKKFYEDGKVKRFKKGDDKQAGKLTKNGKKVRKDDVKKDRTKESSSSGARRSRKLTNLEKQKKKQRKLIRKKVLLKSKRLERDEV